MKHEIQHSGPENIQHEIKRPGPANIKHEIQMNLIELPRPTNK